MPRVFCAFVPIVLLSWVTAVPAQPATPAPLTAAQASRILLLGEVHDNPDGHRQRYAYLQQQVATGWRPALVMEQFDREQQAALTQAQAECPDADCLISRVGGPRWDWAHYRPLIALALQQHLPLVAANVSRADAARVMRQGWSAALPPATLSAMRLDMALPADVQQAQSEAIQTGHCGQAPAALVSGMVAAQVARDVWMAQTLSQQAQPAGAVLIAGNGHVRRDIGVPRWLAVLGLGEVVQSHGFVERNAPAEPQLYDQTHPIAPHPRPDPCAAVILPHASSPV